MKKDKKQAFHNKHEILTDIIFDHSFLLPDRYNFVLTNRCNLKCPFCFLRQDNKSNAMKAQDWIDLAKQLPIYSRVTFTGGEPLFFQGFERVFSYVADRFDCNIISNGTLLTKEKIDLFLSYPKFRILSISIDNIGNTLRRMTVKQWEHVRSMMQYFAKKKKVLRSDCVLEAKTMVLDENAENLLEIRRYCAEQLCCDHHSFQFLKGSPLQHSDEMFKMEEMTAASSAFVYKKFDIIKRELEKIRQYNVKKSSEAFLHPKIADLNAKDSLPAIDFVNKAEHIKENYIPCRFAWSSVHVNADGNIFPCMAISFGNVKTTPLSLIMSGRKCLQFRDVIRREGTVAGCNRCGWLRPWCSQKGLAS